MVKVLAYSENNEAHTLKPKEKIRRLSIDQASRMYELRASGVRLNEISKIFGVSDHTVSRNFALADEHGFGAFKE